MPRRVLVLLVVLLAAALGFLFWSGPPEGGRDGDAPNGAEAAAGAPDATAGLTAGPTGAGEPDSGRSALAASAAGTPLPAAELELGIPSFVGRVLLPDGAAAAGASVAAWGMSGLAMFLDPANAENPPLAAWEVRCDREGRFRLPEPPRDGLRFLVRAQTPDLPPLELANLPAMPGRTRDLGDLRLRAGFSVAGTVSGPGGEPVAGAVVVPVPEFDSAAFPIARLQDLPPLPGYQATADAGGRFTLERLPPGRIRLRAAGAGYVEGLSAGVKAGPGQTVSGVEIQLEVSYPLTGMVLDEGLLALAGARLRLEAEGVELETASGDDGSFRIDAPAGIDRSQLHAAADGYWPATRSLRGDELRLPVEIVLPKLPPITGYVQDAGGAPVAGAFVKLVALSRGRDSDVDPARLDALAEGRSAADGTFQLEPAMTGTWERRFRVAAWAEQHAAGWSSVVSLDEQNLRPPPPVEVILQPGLGIDGVVLGPDGAAAAGARVHLRRLTANRAGGARQPLGAPTRRRSTIWRAANAGSDGAFLFAGVPVGDYRLEAYLPGCSPAEGEDFALLPGRPHHAVLQLLPPSSIEGVVEGPRAALGPLRVIASRGGVDDLDASVDGNGGFRIADAPPGEYQVAVHEVDPALESFFLFGSGEPLAVELGVQVEAGAGAWVQLVVDLEDRATLRGRVTVNGGPAPGMSVYLVPRDLGGMNDPRTGWRNVARTLRSTTADFQGRYVLAALDPADYWVVVDHPGRRPGGIFRFGDEGGDNAGPTGAACDEVRLAGGQESVRDFDLLVGGVIGRARYPIGAEGRLVPAPRGSRGTLSPLGMSGVAAIDFAIGQGGSFRIPLVPAGAWELRLASREATLGGQQILVPSGADAEVDLVMEPRPPKSQPGGR